MKQDFLIFIRPWLHNPRRRLSRETHALARCFLFHDGNNNFRKLTLLILLGVWGAITLGFQSTDAFGVILYNVLTALLFTIIGRQWGLEIRGLTPNISITQRDDDDDDQQS